MKARAALNPAQPDDKQYLEGQKVPLPSSKAYLGVFMTVHNDGDSTVDSVLAELRDVLDGPDKPITATFGHSPAPLPMNNSDALVARNHQYLTGI